jgi:hypothetical protein
VNFITPDRGFRWYCPVGSVFTRHQHLIGSTMSDRSDEYRRAALECLRLARTTSDERTRASLLIMAQRWFDFANGLPGYVTFNAGVRVFIEGQMAPKPMQQQQQIQPKNDDKK